MTLRNENGKCGIQRELAWNETVESSKNSILRGKNESWEVIDSREKKHVKLFTLYFANPMFTDRQYKTLQRKHSLIVQKKARFSLS